MLDCSWVYFSKPTYLFSFDLDLDLEKDLKLDGVIIDEGAYVYGYPECSFWPYYPTSTVLNYYWNPGGSWLTTEGW